ncbi:MAG TPA: response regulator, partial [Parvularculaceae bacterium]|nr:response regulator [Parvularculaceae bacterium]
ERAAAAAGALAAADAPAVDALTCNGRPLDVLVAEDNTVNQLVIRAMLEKLGCTVRLAGDGRRAFELYRETPPDIVLMDVSMPVVDGFQATALIRAHEMDCMHIPIIGVTAHALREDRRRCLDAGMDDYLSKPVRRDALMDILRRWSPIALANAQRAVS